MSKRINLNSNEWEKVEIGGNGLEWGEIYLKRDNSLNEANPEIYSVLTDEKERNAYVNAKIGESNEVYVNKKHLPAINEINKTIETIASDYNELEKIAIENYVLSSIIEANSKPTGKENHDRVKGFRNNVTDEWKKKELNNTINELQRQLKEAEKNKTYLLSQITELGYRNKDLEDEVNALDNDKKKLVRLAFQTESSLSRAQKTIQGDKKKISALKKEIEDLEESLVKNKNEELEYKTEKERLLRVINNEKNPRIKELEQDIKRVKTARKQLEEQLNEALAEKTFLEGRIAQLEEKADEDAKTISKLKERLKNANPILKKLIIVSMVMGLFFTGLGIAGNYEKLLKINKTERKMAAIVEDQTNQVRATLKPLLEEKFGTILDYNDKDTKGYLSVYARKDNVVSVYKIVMPFENLEDYNVKKSSLNEFTEYVKEGQFEAEASFDTEKTNDILLGGKYYNLNGSKADAGLFASDYDNFAATDIQKEVVKDDKGNVLYVVASIDVYQFNDDATNDGVVTRFSKNLSEDEFDYMSAEEVYATLLKTGSRDDLGSCFNFGGELNVEEVLNQIKSGIEMTEAEKKDLQKYLSANVKHFTNNTIQDVVVDTGSVKYITVKNASGKEYLYAIPVTQDGKVDSAREVLRYQHINSIIKKGYEVQKEALFRALTGEEYNYNPYGDKIFPIYVKEGSDNFGTEDGVAIGKFETITIKYQYGEKPEIIENNNVLTIWSNTTADLRITDMTKAALNLMEGVVPNGPGIDGSEVDFNQRTEIKTGTNSASTSDAEASK